MTAAVQGYNTIVKVKDAGGTYHEIAKCAQSDIFSSSWGIADTTHMRSPGKHKEKQTTLRETEPLMLDCIYDSTDPTHAIDSDYGLHALHIGDIQRDFMFVLSDGTEFEYSCKVTKFKVDSVSAENIVKCSAEVSPMEAPLNEP